MNPAHKADEAALFARFRRAWEGAAAISTVEYDDRPDVRGTLADGRPYGVEIARVTDEGRARSDAVWKRHFESELEVACRDASVRATFIVGAGEWQLDHLVDVDHRKRVVAFLVHLAKEAGGSPREFDEDELERRGFDGFDFVAVEPGSDAVGLGLAQHARGLGWVFVKECIAAKDKLAPKYRQEVGAGSALWLLLVAGTTFANGVQIPRTTIAFETLFDRVFFLDCWRDPDDGCEHERVVELPIKRLQAAEAG
jgi:hypothetical protein